jgi:hypothetical protein
MKGNYKLYAFADSCPTPEHPYLMDMSLGGKERRAGHLG